MPYILTKKLCVVCNTNERYENITRMQKIIKNKNHMLSSKQKIIKLKCSHDNEPNVGCTILWNEIDRLSEDIANDLEELRLMYAHWDVI